MEGSVLIISVVEARELKQAKLGAVAPYVELFVESQQQRSTLQDTAHPIWNEKFTL